MMVRPRVCSSSWCRGDERLTVIPKFRHRGEARVNNDDESNERKDIAQLCAEKDQSDQSTVDGLSELSHRREQKGPLFVFVAQPD